jgi:hypothetical protein|tara:strand:- start:155 stop:1114 length:960 start_codon:yes stop_codon:yes gene_type:complete
MVTEAISGLNLDFFDNIYFICLQQHEDKYSFMKGFVSELDDAGLRAKSNIVLLPEQTESQSETVYTFLSGYDLDGFIFIKDSDGFYRCDVEEKNQVAYFDLNDMDDINARTKSYVDLDVNNVVTNIVEKKVISSTFSSGGYGFADAKEFCKTFEKLQDMDGECYISHIIFEMMLSGSTFYGTKTTDFKDWGTLDAWNKYKSQYKCLFVDIDGTLVTNSSHHFPPYVGSGESIEDNIDLLAELHEQGKAKIVLTTSRPERLRQLTLQELQIKGIPYDELVMGLPHCQRIIINDFAKSNPYPSCSAINIPRNENNLKEFLS